MKAPAEPEIVIAVSYINVLTPKHQLPSAVQDRHIREYAREAGMLIIQTYEDPDPDSGISALGRLLNDAANPHRQFDVVLVYDRSSWDDAHYERVLGEYGIQVCYCAGESSAVITQRLTELIRQNLDRPCCDPGERIHRALLRRASEGLHVGGSPPWGLERVPFDHVPPATRVPTPRGRGRAILVPGDPKKVEVVCRIFEMFVRGRRDEQEIAHALAGDGIPYGGGKAWTRRRVRQILTNERYAGRTTYNRDSRTHDRGRRRNPEELWVRAETPHSRVVDPEIFDEAGAIIRARSARPSDADLLAGLRILLERHGRLSAALIDGDPELPSSSAYRARFGSLGRAYELAGSPPDPQARVAEIRRHLAALQHSTVTSIARALRDAGALVDLEGAGDRLAINRLFTASIAVVRCRALSTGELRWHVRVDDRQPPDIAVAVRMGITNLRPLDYYVIPTLDMEADQLWLKPHNGAYLDVYRHHSLDFLIQLAKQMKV